VDVISQGREPKRDFRLPRLRLPPSKRWRIAAGCGAALALAAALTVTGLRLGHDAGTGRTGVAPAFVICSPSTQTCSVRITIVHGEAFRFTQAASKHPGG